MSNPALSPRNAGRRLHEVLLSAFAVCLPGLWGSLASAGAGDALPGFGSSGTYVLPLQTANDNLLLMSYVVVQQDRSLIVVGHNFAELVIMKLTRDGAPDPGYGTGGVVRIVTPGGVVGALLLADGKLLIAADRGFGNPGGELIRLGVTGALDPAFGAAGRAALRIAPTALALAADGRILVGGQTVLSRYLATGVIDASFGSSGEMQLPAGIWPKSLAVAPDLSVIAAGEFVFGGVPRRQRVARVLSTGQVDSQFGSNGFVEATLPTGFGDVGTTSVLIDATGRLLVAAEADTDCTGVGRSCSTVVVHRLLANGVLDSAFGTAGMVSLGTNNFLVSPSLAIQPDGAILVATNGEFTPTGNSVPSAEIVVARLLGTGLLDPAFGTSGIVQRQLTSNSPCYLGGRSSLLGIRPDAAAFVLGNWAAGGTCGVGAAAVTSVLLRDANNDFQPEAWDIVPETLVFPPVQNAPPNTAIFSLQQTVTGLESGVSVPVLSQGGEFALNGATAYLTAGWVTNGDRVQLRQQSSGVAGSSVTMQIDVGGLQPAGVPSATR